MSAARIAARIAARAVLICAQLCAVLICAQICAVSPALAQDKPSEPADGRWRVRYHKSIEIPVGRSEKIRVVNRLGNVTVRGWDKPTVRVKATKSAANQELGARLRVEFTRPAHGDIDVRTYVRLRPLLPRAARDGLYKLMRRQQTLLRAVVSGKLSYAQAAKDISSIQAQASALLQKHARNDLARHDIAPANLSVPLSQGRLDLEVSVPRGLFVDARTFKHGVRVIGCHGGVAASTEEGTLDVERTRGKVVTWTRRGKQRLVRVQGEVDVRGGDSDVVLDKVRGPVRASVLSGRIDARAVGARRAELRSIGGAILVGAVPAGGRYVVRSRDGRLVAEVGRALQLVGRAAQLLVAPALRSTVHRTAAASGAAIEFRGVFGLRSRGGQLELRSEHGSVEIKQ
ncbi:MAG: hypothetical protein KC503_27360 [Myxococcales bacterium]|nr:hypothetical protein [Myxococcales bacterium]